MAAPSPDPGDVAPPDLSDDAPDPAAAAGRGVAAPGARRIALRLAYDGGGYVGWQRQGPSIRGASIQEAVETALADWLGHPVTLQAAGRTDTGVHARGQCAHFDTTTRVPIHAVVPAVQRRLPRDIAVWRADEVDPAFHARHDATRRVYRYLLVLADKNDSPSCLARGRVGHLRGRFDLAAMAAAAALLPGRHDFSRLRSVLCQAESPVRTIDEAVLEPLDATARARLGLFPVHEAAELRIAARAFLMHQVRLIVGALAQVGRGRLGAAAWAALLRGEEVGVAVAPAPPEGLTLDWVAYEGSSYAG